MPKLPNPAKAVVVVGVASTQIAAADDDRKSLIIVNISDETVWIDVNGGIPAVGDGEPIYPGCSVQVTTANLVESQVNGICTSGGKNVVALTDYPPVFLSSSQMTLGTGSATIGAVKIEDADSSVRATVKPAQDYPEASDKALVVQTLGASGEIAGTSPEGATLADVAHELRKIYRMLTVIADDELEGTEP